MNARVLHIVLPTVAAIVYICIDFLYVFLAKSRYQRVVEGIQGKPMEIDVVAAIACYTIMAIGWYFIAVQLALSYVDKLKQRTPTWKPLTLSVVSGLISGFRYGFVVFAVYNLTTRALFSSGYPLSILFQDLAWGSLYNMVYTGVYMIIWSKLTNPVDI